MSNITEYKEILAFHPGYYISEIIESMEINQAEFAIRMGTTPKTLSQLINGQANISKDLAKKLSVMLGTSVEIWQNLQNTYDKKIIEIEKAKDFDNQETLMRLLNYMYFVKVAGLPVTQNSREKTENLCNFFKVSDLGVMMKPDFLVSYKALTGKMSEKDIINSRAWIQTAINMSRTIETKPYNSRKLKSFLPELRSMTVNSISLMMPVIKQRFAECGVVLVLLPPLVESKVNGAVKWVNDNRVVLAMNSKGEELSVFWFSLFHEIRHILQKKIKTVFVNDVEKRTENTGLEDDADYFAWNFLIPPVKYSELNSSAFKKDEEIISFAKSIELHPDIVMKRLELDGKIDHRMNSFKTPYDIPNTERD